MEENVLKDQKTVTSYNVDAPIGTVFTCLFKNNTKLETTLVGYEQDSFFLLKFPTVSGIANYLVKDTPLAVLFKANGYNVTFSSTLSMPMPRKFLAFCNYPSKFKLYEIRNATRSECLVPTALVINKERYFGVVQDISLDGCRVTLDGVQGTALRKIEQGEPVQMEMWTQKDTLIVSGIIMRSLKNISRVSFGISFSEIGKQESAIIQGFIASIQYSGTTNV